jgi:2-dehydropantoate 2-reductase
MGEAYDTVPYTSTCRAAGTAGVVHALDDDEAIVKILMFGRGAITTIYGWALERAGHAVEFYVRPERLVEGGSAVRLEFYDARSSRRGTLIEESYPARLRADIPQDHDYDLIVLSLHYDQFEEAVAALDGRVGGATVLVLGNFWADPEPAMSPLPADRLVWGFPSAGGVFDGTGTLHGALMRSMRFGRLHGGAPTTRELEVHSLFRSAGFSVRQSRDFLGWLWVHFASGAALLPAALMAGSVGKVITSGPQWKRVRENMADAERVLTARGVDLSAHRTSLLLTRLPGWVMVPVVRLALRASKPLRAVSEAGVNEHEAHSSLLALIDEAHRLGVEVPHLEAARRELEARP